MIRFNNTRKTSRYTVLAALYALSGTSVLANTLTVNDLTDIASPGDGKCTLREAVSNANSNSDASGLDCVAGFGADSVTFSVSGTIILGSTLSISDAAGLTVDGIGRNITVSGNNTVRVMQLNPGATLSVKNLTVADGYADPQGGGIYNQFGNLNVINSTFTNNTATRTGGGIASYADLTLANPGGNLTIANSTFSGNHSVFGGAIRNNSGTLSMVNSTIVGNSVNLPICPPGFFCAIEDSGGGIENSGRLNLDNSIVAGNTAAIGAADIGGSVDTGSYNLIGDALVNYRWNGLGPIVPLNGNNGNITGVDASTLVDTTLANNGGPTQTLALLAGSEAIDAADNTICANALVNNLDQRSIIRPQGPQCDIGAFEVSTATSVDLAVSQSIQPNPAMVRDNVTLTITVANNGVADASSVKVVDKLPAGLKSITTSPTGICGLPASGVITCNLGNLGKGTSADITVTGIPSITGTVTNQASATSDQLDNQLANNSVTQSITVQALLCNGLKPTIIGTTGPNIINGTKGRDIIHGLSGNDTISGGNDNDIICGGLGQDTLKGDGGNDTLNGELGTDSCNGGSGTDSAANCEAVTGIP
ncbi:MAG: choice-of-anchor Q domain-containing protein [Methylococcales bacterium]